MPERHDRLAARCEHRVVMFGPLNPPSQRTPECVDERITNACNEGDLGALGPRQAPILCRSRVHSHEPQRRGVTKLENITSVFLLASVVRRLVAMIAGRRS